MAESFKLKIKSVYRAETFHELLWQLTPQALGYGNMSIEEVKSEIAKFFSLNQEGNFGAITIDVEVLE